MFGNSYLQDEARKEAEDIISSWMTSKACTRLTGMDIEAGEHLGENIQTDSSFDFSSLLTGGQFSDTGKVESMFSQNREEEVEDVMLRLNSCLSFDGKDMMEDKVMKKPSFARPIMTMEMRHQRVKEARLKRQEEAEKRHKLLMQKQQMRKAAEDIVKQEVKEEQMRRKMEEDAILKEMNRIRKIVQDQRKIATKAQVVVAEVEQHQQKDVSLTEKQHKIPTETVKETSVASIQSIPVDKTYTVEKLYQKQRRKLLKKFFVAWYKVVLDRNAAMGKAKALSEWNSTMRVWNAWRRYTIIQTTNRSTKLHESNMKQVKLQEHLADLKHNKVIMKRYFRAWKTYVKANVYSKDIWQAHESTKAKMEALVNAIVRDKDKKVEEDLVVECLDDSSYPPSVVEDTPSQFAAERKLRPKPKCKQAWQVTKADVKKLSKREMMQLQPHLTHAENKLAKTQTTARDDVFHPLEVVDQTVVAEKAFTQQPPKTKHPMRARTSKKQVAMQRPRALTEMEKRAEERAKRRQEMIERRKEKERERIEREEREEEERIKEEKEEKRKKMEEAQEAKRLKEQLLKERLAMQVRMRELCSIADQHYKMTLLRKYGIEPWKKFTSDIRQIEDVAISHFYKNTTEKCFYNWLSVFRRSRAVKEARADNFSTFLTKKHAFRQWLAYGEVVSIQEQKADLHYSHLVKRRYVTAWKHFTTNEQLEMFRKEENAETHNKTRLLKLGLNLFVKHHRFLAREKDRSRHVSDMRRKIIELLPDFCPDE